MIYCFLIGWTSPSISVTNQLQCTLCLLLFFFFFLFPATSHRFLNMHYHTQWASHVFQRVDSLTAWTPQMDTHGVGHVLCWTQNKIKKKKHHKATASYEWQGSFFFFSSSKLWVIIEIICHLLELKTKELLYNIRVGHTYIKTRKKKKTQDFLRNSKNKSHITKNFIYFFFLFFLSDKKKNEGVRVTR